MKFLKENETRVKEALRGRRDIDDYMNTAKGIGIKTLGDLKRFKDEEGGAELKDLKRYRKELPKDFKPIEESFEDEHLGEVVEDTETEASIKSIVDDMLSRLITYVKESGRPIEDVLSELQSTLDIPVEDHVEIGEDSIDDTEEPIDDIEVNVNDFDIEPIDYDSIEMDDDIDFDIELDVPTFDIETPVDIEETITSSAIETPKEDNKQLLLDKEEDTDEPVVDYVNENVTATAQDSKPVNLDAIKQ